MSHWGRKGLHTPAARAFYTAAFCAGLVGLGIAMFSDSWIPLAIGFALGGVFYLLARATNAIGDSS